MGYKNTNLNTYAINNGTTLGWAMKCFVLVGFALQVTKHYFPVAKSGHFAGANNLYQKISGATVKAEADNKIVDLYGNIGKSSGDNKKWGTTVTPVFLNEYDSSATEKEAINRIIDPRKGYHGSLWKETDPTPALWGVLPGDTGHAVAIEKIHSMTYRPSTGDWKINATYTDIYGVTTENEDLTGIALILSYQPDDFINREESTSVYGTKTMQRDPRIRNP